VYQSTKIIILILVSVVSIQAQFNLSVSAGLDYYDQKLNYEYSSVYNIGASYRFHPNNVLGFEYQRNNLQQIIASPSGSKFIPMSVSDFKINYSYLLIQDIYSINISPVVGFGVKYFQKSAHTVNLGALGNKTIPGTNESFYTASVALDFSRNIYKQIALFVRPEISVYDFKNLNKTYSIAGGIDVRLF